MALPCGTTGSLSPGFPPARLVGLTSQARLCLCTLRLISKQPERTFERLRYSLEATAPVKLPT